MPSLAGVPQTLWNEVFETKIKINLIFKCPLPSLYVGHEGSMAFYGLFQGARTCQEFGGLGGEEILAEGSETEGNAVILWLPRSGANTLH